MVFVWMPADVRAVLEVCVYMRLRRDVQSNDVDGAIVLVEAHLKYARRP